MHPLGRPAVVLGGAREEGTTVKTTATCLPLQTWQESHTWTNLLPPHMPLCCHSHRQGNNAEPNRACFIALRGFVGVWVWVWGSPIPNRSILEGSAHKSEPNTRRHPSNIGQEINRRTCVRTHYPHCIQWSQVSNYTLQEIR